VSFGTITPEKLAMLGSGWLRIRSPADQVTRSCCSDSGGAEGGAKETASTDVRSNVSLSR